MMGVGGAVGLGACGLNTDLPHRDDGAAPVSSGIMMSGVREPGADAALGPGFDTVISNIKDVSGGDASAIAGGTDSGGAQDESAGGIGGAASTVGGAAGAGGVGGGSKGSARGGASSMGGASGAGHGGTSAAGSASSPPPTLYFSEYVEGSSAYKALEIATRERSVLEGCKVGTYFNGKTEATVVATLSGVLDAGQVLTLCSSALQVKLGATLCKQVGNLTFNGNDVVSISCAGKILDVIGQVGVDPGTGWGVGSSTLDQTLRRNCTVTSGDVDETNAFDTHLEWQAFPVDTFDGLGSRGC